MDSTKKRELLRKCKNKYYTGKNKTIDSSTEQFKKKIKEGPYYICCVCSRTLYSSGYF